MTSLQVGDEAEIDEALGFLVNRGVDGLIAVAPSTGIARAAGRAARGVPMVVVADGFAPSEHIHVVSVDQGLGAGMAVRHLAGRGRSRIAHIAGPGDWFDARARPCTRLNPMLGSLPFFAGLFDYENNSCPGLFHGRKRLKRPPETQH